MGKWASTVSPQLQVYSYMAGSSNQHITNKNPTTTKRVHSSHYHRIPPSEQHGTRRHNINQPTSCTAPSLRVSHLSATHTTLYLLFPCISSSLHDELVCTWISQSHQLRQSLFKLHFHNSWTARLVTREPSNCFIKHFVHSPGVQRIPGQ